MVEKCLERVKLDVADAASLTKSMRRQLKAGDVRSAFQTALDIQPHLQHANDVIQAASLFARPIRES